MKTLWVFFPCNIIEALKDSANYILIQCNKEIASVEVPTMKHLGQLLKENMYYMLTILPTASILS